MGGGTRHRDLISVVAEVALKSGALTIAIVTKPFTSKADIALEQQKMELPKLATKCDTLIIIPNDKLLSIVTNNQRRSCFQNGR